MSNALEVVDSADVAAAAAAAPPVFFALLHCPLLLPYINTHTYACACAYESVRVCVESFVMRFYFSALSLFDCCLVLRSLCVRECECVCVCVQSQSD